MYTSKRVERKEHTMECRLLPRQWLSLATVPTPVRPLRAARMKLIWTMTSFNYSPLSLSLSLSLSLGDPSASCVDKLFIRYNIYHFQTCPTTILLILQLFLLRLLAFIIPTKFSMSLLSDFLS